MVYEKYIKRGGKVFGPYYYESYREGDKIYKRYLGTELPKKKNVTAHNNRWIFLVLSLVVLFGMFYLFQANLTTTGKASLDIQSSYKSGERLDGKLEFNLKAGELVPKDSKVRINLGGEEKEIFLNELVSDSTVYGSYFASGSSISGEGEGYGIAGEKISYPEVSFSLEIFKKGTEEGGIGAGGIEEENASLGNEIIVNETAVGNETLTNETIANETAVGNESMGENVGVIVNESAGDNNEEKKEEKVEEKENKTEEKNENKAEVGITGEAVRENSYIINGKASKNNSFSYPIDKKEDAKLVSGSVKANAGTIEDNAVSLKIIGEMIEVSTDYSTIEKGFGEEYLGEKGLSLEIDLEKFDFSVNESGKLSVELVYGDIAIVKTEEDVNVEGMGINESEINITEINLTEINITEMNITKINVTEMNVTGLNVSEGNLSFIKDIENIRMQKGQNATIDLLEYFANAENYSFEGLNISAYFENSEMTLMPDEEFTGARKGKIIAYSGFENSQNSQTLGASTPSRNESIESNEFSILVSSGNVNINTAREKIVVGQRVKWTRNVSLEVAENITIELEKGAENISVTKIENGVESEAIATITGGVISEERGEKKRLIGKIRGLFGVTGRAVQETNVSAESVVEVALNDSATRYIIEYWTEAPQAFEEEMANGKKVIVSAPDELNYTDVLSFTNISESYKVGEESKIKIYWREGKSYVAFDAYDMNGNGALDYVEWIVPHLSNQTFDIILITKAEHLDSNRTFVEDVYEEVKERDNVWKEIPEGEYLRVTFERNLTSEKDITIYARSNNSGSVGVYEKDENELIADFETISEDKEYKVYLSNWSKEGGQNIFDLLVKGGIVEFDWVVDPTEDVSTCRLLNLANTVYNLTNNVSSTTTCFNVTASNVTLECNRYTINYSTRDSSYSGIYSNQNFTTIKNCIIMGGTHTGNSSIAIAFINAGNGTINNNTIAASGNFSYGLVLSSSGSSDNTFSSNTITISGASGIGIYLPLSASNTFSSNTITILGASANGIYLSSSASNTFSNNTITTSGNSGN